MHTRIKIITLTAFIGMSLCGVSCNITWAGEPLPIAAAQGIRNGTDDTNRLLPRVEKQRPGYIGRDSAGNVTSMILPTDCATDYDLTTVSGIPSVTELKIYVDQHSQALTKQGVSSLSRLTNLIVLSIWCSGLLSEGVMSEVSKLTRLRRLELVAVDAPKEEYLGLTNLQNLVELRVAYAPNFGDRELLSLTNLSRLRSLNVDVTGVSSQGTNTFARLPGLTNRFFRLRNPTPPTSNLEFRKSP